MLVWMDLEMTGLDPALNAIVEIATLVTDDDLAVVAEGPDLVVHQPPEVLATMDDVVRKMHTKSGLLAAIESSTVSSPRPAPPPSSSSRATCPNPEPSPSPATPSAWTGASSLHTSP